MQARTISTPVAFISKLLDLAWWALGSGISLASHHAAKANVAGRCVHGLGVACSRPVAPAVVWRAQMRAALDHLAWNSDVGLARIVARSLGPSAGIFRNAASLRRIGRMHVRVPV